MRAYRDFRNGRNDFFRAFTMIELLAAIAIVAVITALVIPWVGNYMSWARLTAARHTCAVLNESLNEYRALGGLRKAYDMEGSTGSTLNAATLTTAAIEHLRSGFENSGQTVGFIHANQEINTAYIGSTGSGSTFRFVVDEDSASSGTNLSSTTPTLSVPNVVVKTGTAATMTVTVSGIASGALDGQSVTLTIDGISYSDTEKLSSDTATFTLPADTDVGIYTADATLGAHTIGGVSYVAASSDGTLTVWPVLDDGVGYMANGDADGGYSILTTTSTGYMAFNDGSTTTVESVSSSTVTTLDATDHYTFWASDEEGTMEGNITAFSCFSSSLTSLDVSECPALTYLGCGVNSLKGLNVSGCSSLTTLYCYANSLTSLDVSGCSSLTTFLCYSNLLKSLDVSNHTALSSLECNSNSLTSLDVSGCSALTALNCFSNSLTSLDTSNLTNLKTINCQNNNLTTLSVSGCSSLSALYCLTNALTSLDVSECTALKYLWCYSNQLTSLDLETNTALAILKVDSDVTLTGVPDGCTVTTY